MYSAKINGINMFINKLNTAANIINLDELKQTFRLDEGENGFYKLSLSEKKIIGSETINENYNRPPVGPIEDNLYCTFCSSIGPEDHATTCPFPEKDSLNLTLKAFGEYVLNKLSYSGDYMDFKEKWSSNRLTQEDLNEILLIPDEILIENGTFNPNEYPETFTNISFFGIYKKRGPKKLAPKTATTQFLNNIIISYENENNKTSIRISKNGLINIINIPNDRLQVEYVITELIKRINETSAVNVSSFNLVTGEEFTEYTMIKDFSFIHSTSGQFTISGFESGTNQIDFDELDSMISPFDSSGNVINGQYTTVIKTSTGSDIIIISDKVRIIEWEYSLGRLTRNQVMSKEYIKFVSNPAPGLKLTGIINKYGVVMMTISRCSENQIRKGLCGSGRTAIDGLQFNNVVEVFNKIFNENKEILIRKSFDKTGKLANTFNTVTGYAPSGKICRLTRTRDTGSGNYKEGMRPDPYSWKGSCPDPNYQYLKPEGVQDENGLWFPCCETKTKESIRKMKEYLLTGFPKNKEQAEIYNIVDGEDLGSGILIPGSNVVGATTNVNINGKLEEVTVIKKLSKRSNEYQIKKKDGKTMVIKGTDFQRDSRVFPGLNSFDRIQLLNCILNNIKRNDLQLTSSGELIKNNTSEMNEKFNGENASYFINIIDRVYSIPFTYYSINKMKDVLYTVRKCPKISYNFYLVLSPFGNFYIDNNLNSLDSQISNSFTDTIVLNGYLLFNDIENMNEYNIVDILYFNEKLSNKTFNERYRTLFDLQNLVFTNITDEIFVYPDIYSNVIDGSYSIINSDNNSKLIFISDQCCDLIVWGEKDVSDDIIQLQILEKNRNTITFGYEDNFFPDNIGLDFFKNYSFNKRDIPEDLFVKDYFNVKINRDSNGNIVPNRKISILDKTERKFNYSEEVNLLLLKFNNINEIFFSSNDMWILPNETLIFNGDVLIEE